MMFLILVGYLIVIVPQLASAKQWKELWVAGTLTSLAIAVSGLMMLGVEFPNITSLILQAFLKLYRMIGINA